MLTLYGIPNCDSCRKARTWLDRENVAHRFHDLRADGVDRDMLERWLSAVDWQALLNTRSATWRALDDEDKAHVDAASAIDLMLAYPTLIKRPVAESGDTVLTGFSPATYATLTT